MLLLVRLVSLRPANLLKISDFPSYLALLIDSRCVQEILNRLPSLQLPLRLVHSRFLLVINRLILLNISVLLRITQCFLGTIRHNSLLLIVLRILIQHLRRLQPPSNAYLDLLETIPDISATSFAVELIYIELFILIALG